MASEMKSVCKSQIREALEGENSLTLKYDGTMKGRLGHLAEVELATKENTFVTGLGQQVGGTANEYVETIEEACNNVREGLVSEYYNR